jgi:hypothetical protein
MIWAPALDGSVQQALGAVRNASDVPAAGNHGEEETVPLRMRDLPGHGGFAHEGDGVLDGNTAPRGVLARVAVVRDPDGAGELLPRLDQGEGRVSASPR